MGHMNVQYYTASFDQAMWGLVHTLGWRPEKTPRRTGFADVKHLIHFQSELKPGIPICVYSIPLKAGRTSFVSGHQLINLSTGELSAEMEMTSVYFDLENRVAIPIPSLLKEAADSQWTWIVDKKGKA
jgi:acyl-CoA thioester hydrolase